MHLLSPLSIFVLSRSLGCSTALAQRAKHARIPPSSHNLESRTTQNTIQQENYKHALECPLTRLVVASGPAGTGKTFMAVAHAVRALKNKEYDKIILTRPTVTVESESLGFLPGDVNGKMLPFILPVVDVLQTNNKKSALAEVQAMLSSGIIEVVPLAFVRGRTFNHAFIICDEMQNSTPTKMKAVLTRLGQGSKIVVTGDPGQQDLDIATSGFCDLVYRISKEPSNKINFVQLGVDDVQRDVFVKDILRIYKESGNRL